MKRYDIIALLLVIYLAVMAYFGRGMLLSGNYWEYFSIIGVTLLVIFILRWAMKRREKIREERRKKQDASERRTLRNDNMAILVGIGGDFAWNKEYKDNSIDIVGSIRYYTLTTLFLGVNAGYTHAWYKPKGSDSKCRDYLYIGAELGYAIFVSQNISLDPAVYWKHSFTDKFNQYGIKMGFSVYF